MQAVRCYEMTRLKTPMPAMLTMSAMLTMVVMAVMRTLMSTIGVMAATTDS